MGPVASGSASDPQSSASALDPLGELRRLKQNMEQRYREVADEHVKLCIEVAEVNASLELVQKTPTKGKTSK